MQWLEHASIATVRGSCNQHFLVVLEFGCPFPAGKDSSRNIFIFISPIGSINLWKRPTANRRNNENSKNARASDSMFYSLTMCALQIVFMIMIIKPRLTGTLNPTHSLAHPRHAYAGIHNRCSAPMHRSWIKNPCSYRYTADQSKKTTKRPSLTKQNALLTAA